MSTHGTLIAVLGLAVAGTSEPAFAEQPVAQLIDGYYGGEANAAYVITGLSVASIVGGSLLIARGSELARGFGWPLLTLGSAELIGAVFYAFQAAAELDHYQETLARDPGAFQEEELEHIHGTTSRFVYYRAAELGLVAIGGAIAAIGGVTDHDLVAGIGLGISTVAVPVFIIDTINQRRAVDYQDGIRSFRASVAPLGGDGGWSLSIAGRF